MRGDENFNVYAVDPSPKPAAGADAPASRDLTGLKGVRVALYDVPKSDPDMFSITSTMVITTPGATISVHGVRYMSFLGLFLFKDVISLGVSFYLISYFAYKAILSENRGE